jgi:hypothetical protein
MNVQVLPLYQQQPHAHDAATPPPPRPDPAPAPPRPGPEPGPTDTTDPRPRPYADELTAGPAGLRVAVTTCSWSGSAVDPEVAGATGSPPNPGPGTGAAPGMPLR